jgi:predicted secreted Zn-dependent protease
MIKGIIAFLLLVTIAAFAFAGEEGADHSPVDINNSLQATCSVIPPVVTEKYEYYEVCGICEKDIQCDLKQKCITWNDGKKYDSVTNWKFKWSYGYSITSSACRADSFTVTVDVVFMLPKWTQTADAPPQLVDKWNKFISNLMIHERGHRDLAVAAAEELSRAVGELPPARTCADLDKEVQDLGHLKMKSLNEKQKAYDLYTNHGKKQGAVFP